MKKSKLKRIQGRLGLTNRAFADLLGVTESAVEKWRNGSQRVTRQIERHLEMILEHEKDVLK